MVFLAAGCGTEHVGTHSASQPDALPQVVAAAQVTGRAGSARLKVVTHSSEAGPGSSAESTTTQHGFVDFGRGYDLTSQLPTGQATETRRIGSTSYAKVPDVLAAQTPGHKPWLKESAPSKSASSVLAVAASNPADPAATLTELQHYATARKVGTADIGVIPTTDYRLTVDLSKLAKAAPGGCSAFASSTAHSETIDMWVDHQQLIRQLRLVTPLPLSAGLQAASTPSPSPTASSASATITITESFTGYGPVRPLTAPPAAQTTTVAALIKHQQQHLGKATPRNTNSAVPCPTASSHS